MKPCNEKIEESDTGKENNVEKDGRDGVGKIRKNYALSTIEAPNPQMEMLKMREGGIEEVLNSPLINILISSPDIDIKSNLKQMDCPIKRWKRANALKQVKQCITLAQEVSSVPCIDGRIPETSPMKGRKKA